MNNKQHPDNSTNTTTNNNSDNNYNNDDNVRLALSQPPPYKEAKTLKRNSISTDLILIPGLLLEYQIWSF